MLSRTVRGQMVQQTGNTEAAIGADTPLSDGGRWVGHPGGGDGSARDTFETIEVSIGMLVARTHPPYAPENRDYSG